MRDDPELIAVVQVRWPRRRVWETMCAMNSVEIATEYARQSLIGKPDGFGYRVYAETAAGEWTLVAKFGAAE